jgi:tRNA pseudouridine65 synthase
MQLDLLHEDAVLAAFAKPSGLLVHRGWGDDRVTALDLAREQLGRRVFPVHRLDRATSGVLLFALTSEAAAAIHACFEDGRVHKRYLALVRGAPPASGVVDHPIPRREDGPRVPAVTAYRRLAVVDLPPLDGAPEGRHPARYALVEALPATGRLHQVRRHMKHLGHPVIGDVNYGKGDHNRLFRERFGLRRLALHAAELRLPHPRTGLPLTIAAALPLDLRGPFERLGLAAD